MHGLQLSRILAVGALALSAGGVFVVRGAPWRIIPQETSELARAPQGYVYRGKAFTGAIYGWGRGHLTRLSFVWRGRLQGPDLQWFANGQRSIERHYRGGLESGEHRAWYEDGRVKFLKRFRAGVPHGEFFEWHANGQLAQFVTFDQGREVVAKSWTAGGKPFYNYVWRENQKVGLQGDTFCSISKK